MKSSLIALSMAALFGACNQKREEVKAPPPPPEKEVHVETDNTKVKVQVRDSAANVIEIENQK